MKASALLVPLTLFIAGPLAAAEPVTETRGGITFQFPPHQRDLVEPLFDDIVGWRNAMRENLDRVEENNQAALTGEGTEETIFGFLASPLGLGSPPDPEFVKAYRATATEASRFAPAWTRWLDGFDTVRFWSREDAGDRYDPETESYTFQDISFPKDGNLNLRPKQFQSTAAELPTSADEVPPLQIDIPTEFAFSPTPDRYVAVLGKMISELDDLLLGLRQSAVNQFTIGRVESALREYVTTTYFDPEAAAVLAGPVAKFGSYLTAKAVLEPEALARLYQPFFELSVPPDREERLQFFQQAIDDYLDPDPKRTVGFRRGILMHTFLTLSTETGKSPIALAGVEAIPEGGHTAASFAAAIDAQLGGDKKFRDRFAAEITELSDKDTAIATVENGRVTEEIGGLTFSYPTDLADQVRAAAPTILTAREATIDQAEATRAAAPAPFVLPGTLAADLAGFGLADTSETVAQFLELGAGQENVTLEMADAILAVDHFDVWVGDDLVAYLKAGGTVPFVTPTEDGINFALDWKPDQVIDSLPILLSPKISDAGEIVEALVAFHNVFVGTAQKAFSSLGSMASGERGVFVALHEGVEFALVQKVIQSKDRRWFCDGLANVIAIRLADRYLGEGRGEAIFESLYPPDEREPEAEHVDLLVWPTAEDEKEGEETPHTSAHYYFATHAMQQALEGRPDDFIARWIAEIQKTPVEETTMETVEAAYAELTGGKSLREIAERITKPRRTSELSGFTFAYPPELEAAVRAAAPEMHAIRETFRDTVVEDIGEAFSLPESLDRDFAQLGLGSAGNIVEWFGSLPSTSNALGPEFIASVLAVDRIEIWLSDSLKVHFEGGGTVEGVTRSDSGVEIVFDKSDETGRYPDSLPMVFPSDMVPDDISTADMAGAIRDHYKFDLTLATQGMGVLAEAYAGDRGMFVALHEGAEFALVREVIGSPDRRWFCDGLANAIAIRLCDRYLGDGRGQAVFESLYPPEKLVPEAEHVDLLAWPTAEDEGEVDTPHTPAHYYFATRVIQRALASQPDAFIARWIAEIKKTPVEETTMETVEAAYAELTDGKSLREIAKRITSP
ncbi:hypothetical protein BH23VER1_BH23VER1_15360 [soil metagenome]